MWSKFINTHIGKIAKEKMEVMPLQYHNWQHILDGFDYLERTNVPYDPDLDIAWIYHDVVYDKLPEKEFRSAGFLSKIWQKNKEQFEGVDLSNSVKYILCTIRHEITEKSSWQERAIIRTDLQGLSNVDTALTNYNLICQESKELYEIDLEDFSKANFYFMMNMEWVCQDNAFVDDKNAEFWKQVETGVKFTKELSKLILDTHEEISYK